VAEKDEEGYYIVSVPEMPGCHTQAKTSDQAMKRIKEAIQADLDVKGAKDLGQTELVGIQFDEVHTE
jgi:predicted RNase H-like HicB family nuclease